ncbi:MAG TPA: hypothetical protein VF658_08780 [Pyrinomonadaceae bacterium]|jgi:hypothetical protein
MKKKKETNLGRYLYSIRIQRGFANISDYLRKYELPISDVYYRDVESGAKIVSLETADRLCHALHTDRHVFYFHLMRDLLPADIVEKLIKPIADDTFSSLEERQALLERDKTIYREAFAKSMLSETYVLSEDAVHLLLERIDLMPVLHFLYAIEFATAEQLASVLDQNSIPDSPEKVAEMFATTGMALLEGELTKPGGWQLRRKAVISRLPLTEEAKKLKRAFALREVGKTLQQKPLNTEWSDTGSFVDSFILELPPESVNAVRARILDTLAEAQAGEESITYGRSTPYFLGIFFGSRTEYCPKNSQHNQSEELKDQNQK